MPKYIMFTEYNDHEGETWTWFIPHDGHEKQYKQIQKLCESGEKSKRYRDGDFPYTVSLVEFSTEAVFELLPYCPSGYHDSMNFVPKITRQIPTKVNWDDDTGDPLYKGGLF